MHAKSPFNVLLKIVVAALVATLYLAGTATPQFPEQRLIPLQVPTDATLTDPEDYNDLTTNTEEAKSEDPSLPSHKFVVYGRASTHERVGIARGVDYRPIRHARQPELVPAARKIPNLTTFNPVPGSPNTKRMPDLEGFFEFGGTLELLTTDNKTTDNRLKKYDIVMSELMWGVDGGINTSPNYKTITIKVTDPNNSNTPIDVKVPQLVNQEVQWIELYNTTDAEIKAELYLLFTPFKSYPDRNMVRPEDLPLTLEPDDLRNKDYIVLDAVSTLLFGRWQLPGKSGRRPRTTLVSAYRNIDYKTVENRNLSREARLAGIPFGSYKQSWQATPDGGRRNTELRIWHALTSQFVDIPYIATPGEKHVPEVFIKPLRPKSVNANTIVINEVRNDTSRANVDWVELKNASTRTINLKDWELSIVTGVEGTNRPEDLKDEVLVTLPEHTLKRGEILLLLNERPFYTDLADGINIEEPEEHRRPRGLTHQYFVAKGLDLPNDKKFLLLLRSQKNQNGNDAAIEDYAGNGFFSDGLETQFWPRIAQPTPRNIADFGENSFASRHRAWARTRYQRDDGHHKDAWRVVETQGGIGYAPGADLEFAPGTPGYENTALKTQVKNTISPLPNAEYSDGDITISEIMYDPGPKNNGLQWIELYNSSMTQAVSLKGWELEIRNLDDPERQYVNGRFAFKEAVILPNATLLLVPKRAGTNVAINRIYDLYRNHRWELALVLASRLLNPNGFHLTLTDRADPGRDGDDIVVDMVGNLKGEGRLRTKAWDLPAVNPERRRSIVRLYGGLFKPLKGPRDGKPKPADGGMKPEGWRLFPKNALSWTYYGTRGDLASPGYRLGGALPVVLSSFRPVRTETGDVRVKWRTASELNNAGFNILRSTAPAEGFRVVNVKGIVPGQGTSGETHLYVWTDTTAARNTVYYYRLEDVSFDGVRQTLATVRLKGDVAAAGKLTTSWGALKSRSR